MNVCAEYNEDRYEINVVCSLIDENNDTPAQQHNANDSNESATSKVMEQWEALLLDAAEHVKMSQEQGLLYQAKVKKAVVDAKVGIAHGERTYTFVVVYSQNMELPIYNSQQPDCMYYYSPLSVYNLGMVNHAHVYQDGRVSEHMYAYVYHKGVSKKGANNVSSLIVKTLHQLNLLQDDSVGGELNIIFDNCLGQNKNNTVLMLAMWLKAMGYFASVNFIFLILLDILKTPLTTCLIP